MLCLVTRVQNNGGGFCGGWNWAAYGSWSWSWLYPAIPALSRRARGHLGPPTIRHTKPDGITRPPAKQPAFTSEQRPDHRSSLAGAGRFVRFGTSGRSGRTI